LWEIVFVRRPSRGLDPNQALKLLVNFLEVKKEFERIKKGMKWSRIRFVEKIGGRKSEIFNARFVYK